MRKKRRGVPTIFTRLGLPPAALPLCRFAPWGLIYFFMNGIRVSKERAALVSHERYPYQRKPAHEILAHELLVPPFGDTEGASPKVCVCVLQQYMVLMTSLLN